MDIIYIYTYHVPPSLLFSLAPTVQRLIQIHLSLSVSGLGLEQVKNKKRGPAQPEGRYGTGKYLDGAWTEAHTNHEFPL